MEVLINLEELIEILNECFDENSYYGPSKLDLQDFERIFFSKLASLFDVDKLSLETREGILEDFKNCDTIDEFISSNSVVNLINYLYENKILLSLDNVKSRTFYGNKDEKLFVQIFSNIHDVEFKHNYVKQNEMIAYSILKYGKREDGLFEECFKKLVLNGTLDNLRYLPFTFKLDYSYEDVVEMENKSQVLIDYLCA